MGEDHERRYLCQIPSMKADQGSIEMTDINRKFNFYMIESCMNFSFEIDGKNRDHSFV